MFAIESIADAGDNLIELRGKNPADDCIIVSSDLVAIYRSNGTKEPAEYEVKLHKVNIIGIEDGGRNRVRIRTERGSFIAPSSTVDITPLDGIRGRENDLEITLQEMPNIFGRHSPSTEVKPTRYYGPTPDAYLDSNRPVIVFDINGSRYR